jgi:hypothetical protein
VIPVKNGKRKFDVIKTNIEQLTKQVTEMDPLVNIPKKPKLNTKKEIKNYETSLVELAKIVKKETMHSTPDLTHSMRADEIGVVFEFLFPSGINNVSPFYGLKDFGSVAIVCKEFSVAARTFSRHVYGDRLARRKEIANALVLSIVPAPFIEQFFSRRHLQSNIMCFSPRPQQTYYLGNSVVDYLERYATTDMLSDMTYFISTETADKRSRMNEFKTYRMGAKVYTRDIMYQIFLSMGGNDNMSRALASHHQIDKLVESLARITLEELRRANVPEELPPSIISTDIDDILTRRVGLGLQELYNRNVFFKTSRLIQRIESKRRDAIRNEKARTTQLDTDVRNKRKEHLVTLMAPLQVDFDDKALQGYFKSYLSGRTDVFKMVARLRTSIAKVD